MNATILLASPSPDKLDGWRQGLEGFATATAVNTLSTLEQDLLQIGPEILIVDLDLPELEGRKGIARLLQINPATRVIALSDETSDANELALFRIGVRGCCRSDIDAQQLKRVVVAVMQGELWIRRTITPHLLNELGARLRDDSENRRAAVARLADLTRREWEIADLVGKGACNKQIARQLTIAESTVKAHLTEIFRKLGTADRLKLALLVIDMSDA